MIEFIYPIAVVVLGLIISTATLILLSRMSNKLIIFFQLFPESKGVLSLSLRLITWGISGIVFLLFLRFALQISGLAFTTQYVEQLIFAAPQYIIAIVLIVAGFYVSRMIKEKSAMHSFSQKNRVLLVIDFIVHMTFFFTALLLIGVDTRFFEIFYIFALAVIGLIVAFTVGIALGVPLGVGLYKRLMKRGERRKKK